MKKIALLLTLIISTITCFGQTIEVSQFGSTTVSRPTVAASSDQIADYAKRKLHNKIPNPSFFKTPNTKVFSIGNVLVSITFGTLKKNYPNPDAWLNVAQTNLDGIFRGTPNYTSSIETINNKRFYINCIELGGGKMITFYSVNSATLTTMHGSIQYAPEDEVEAKTTLKELLHNFKFKVQ